MRSVERPGSFAEGGGREMMTSCERCGNEVEDIAVMCCKQCGRDGLCPDCYHDHGCDNFEEAARRGTE